MARELVETPATGGLAGDFAGVFSFLIDPAAAARRLPRKFFWIAPFILASIVMCAIGVYNLPLVQEALANQPPPPNVSPEQYQHMGMIGAKVGVYITPILIAVFAALSAAVMLAAGFVMDLKARFLECFNLMMGLTIITIIQMIVSTLILHVKGEPGSVADLQPALGLDIFAPATASKVLVGFLGFFNIFTIWQIAMAIAIVSVAYGVGKGKAAAVVAPVFLIGLILKVAGAAFSR